MRKTFDTSPSQRYMLTCPVFLIGFMGAGKTTLGKFLGTMYGLPHVDSDRYIQARENKTVTTIFREQGEDIFRNMETDVLRFFAHMTPPAVISCGGGVVVRAENIDIMRESGYVIWLEETASDAEHRISDISNRPLFHSASSPSNEHPDELSPEDLIAERTPLYKKASDMRVSTTGRASFDVAKEVAARLLQAHVLRIEKLL